MADATPDCVSPPIIPTDVLARNAIIGGQIAKAAARRAAFELADAGSPGLLLRDDTALSNMIYAVMLAALKTTNEEPAVLPMLAHYHSEPPTILRDEPKDAVSEGSTILCSDPNLNSVLFAAKPELHTCRRFWLRSDHAGVWTLIGYK